MAQQEGALQHTKQLLVFFPGVIVFTIDIDVSSTRDIMALPSLTNTLTLAASTLCLQLLDVIVVDIVRICRRIAKPTADVTLLAVRWHPLGASKHQIITVGSG
jgi:hypothetical protein